MSRLRNIANNHGKVFLKYAVVGVSGTLIDVLLFTFLIATTPLGNTIGGHVAAATVSFVLAVVNNYTWNRKWTFRSHKAAIHRQFTKFFLVSSGGWLLNTLFLTLFSFVLLQFFIGGIVVPQSDVLPTWGSTLAKIGASCVVLVYNFLANRFWTFAEAPSRR